jgi:hypothetical protein
LCTKVINYLNKPDETTTILIVFNIDSTKQIFDTKRRLIYTEVKVFLVGISILL